MSIAERVTDHLHPLLAALKADPSGASAFWERMEAERTPLIEPDPAHAGHSLVTYVYPMPEGAKHVVMHPGFGESKDNVLERLDGSLDLAEPFGRIREAIVEARRMGVTGKN